MKSILSIIVLICTSLILTAQTNGVGIGTNTPTHTLEVNGNTKLSGNLYFENPGNYTGSSAGSYFLVRDNSDNVIKRYVPATSAFSAINSTVYSIINISTSGITDFDTGIPTSKYHVIIGGFIVRGQNNDSNINITRPNNLGDYIPQYSARSFKGMNAAGVETWRIKFTPNNGRIFDRTAEIRLSVSAYRRDMLTTINNQIDYNMNAVTNGVASIPAPALP
ncbi:hypothetical protein FY557_12780 [Chryseobacterium sp. SN22]|uniref:hypothetical protein n=1 Tax=Chryseobacterium sp. SN22 TaxID=2606431 RepID=UPI0011ED75E3|nr:hypothetical protein [Chryseobacterium sp. SN22]KAA0127490.1 hypothetical protein FY557_12780 [Chryseobacterium sp. SN22]